MNHHPNLLETSAEIGTLLAATRRIAVLGIKPESHDDQPAHYVPAALAAAGYEIVPVPVYYRDVTVILGQPVYRRLVDVPGPIDLVDVFRLPAALPGHLDDLLAAKPRAVWLQTGIRDDAFALTLAEAGILVVQDRCLMVEQQRRGARPAI
ncbi:CoA-binding protein [uncultured Nevskia sp.]|uniref:CoA-binding protein n=1 Tax=uncultured Nevskia sp. TaxID=228950 RepID=UPI0025CDB5BA|nr:CoA-binding protein [uncultured Nevskia sp.]